MIQSVRDNHTAVLNDLPRPGRDLSILTQSFPRLTAKYKDVFCNEMMVHELGLQPPSDEDSPLKNGMLPPEVPAPFHIMSYYFSSF